MKDRYKLIIKGIAGAWFCFLSFSTLAQGGLNLNVNKQYGIAVRYEGSTYKQQSKENILNAKTLSDLYDGFPASWIGFYNRVEITVKNNGEENKVSGKSHALNLEQLKVLKKTDYGSEIDVVVKYIPNRTGIDAEEKEINFSFVVIPEIAAEYKDGFQAMQSYLLGNTIDRFSYKQLSSLETTTVHFTIDENGQPINVELLQSSNDKEADRFILEALNSMPIWKPAAKADGTHVSQNFVFSLGEQIGC